MSAIAGEPACIVIELDEEAVQAAFAEVMRDWGHAITADGLRFPTSAEIREAAARNLRRGRCRDVTGHWIPLP